ncbi:MAG: hypothetical protein SFV81_02790 [Pirellulaceae bacterium]|nr:hypothetical protein [Pirellulaceae bacterium]
MRNESHQGRVDDWVAEAVKAFEGCSNTLEMLDAFRYVESEMLDAFRYQIL